MADDVWRIARKVEGNQMCLASSKVDGYVQFYYSSGEKLFDFSLQEARMIHSALGAMLPDMKDLSEAPISEAGAASKSKGGVSAPVNAKNQGTRWADDEDKKLKVGYHNGKTIIDLAQIHGRSPAAIISRLYAHDLIEVTSKERADV